MDDQEVLQHLLTLEAQAADLVNEAQTEADRRVSEGEKQSRIRYDEAYAREVEALEISYTKNIAMIKDDYRKQLEIYRESLKALPTDAGAFSSLAEKFLVVNPGRVSQDRSLGGTGFSAKGFKGEA